MRLAIVVYRGSALGGAETMLHTLLRNIDRERATIELVFLEAGPFPAQLAALGYPCSVIPAGALKDPARFARTVGALARRLHRMRPDVVLSWAPQAHLYAGLAAPRASSMWWQHGLPVPDKIDRAATAIPARAVGCSSRASAEGQASIRPRRRTFVVHPGIEPPGHPDGATVRARLGIPPHAFVVGIVGRLQTWKGQHRVIEALSHLRDERTHGLVVGGDAYGLEPDFAAHVASLPARLGLEGRVHLTGQVAHPLPYVAAMDVLVNASDAEPFGIVLLEAMALGVPVVAVGRAGPSEILEHRRSGLLTPSNEPAQLAEALRLLLNDTDLRARLSAAGRARFLTSFTASAMADGFLAGVEQMR